MKYFYDLNGMNYFILSSVFAVTGIMILRRLKTNFNSFYSQNRKILISATIALSLPLLLRSIENLLRGFVPDIEKLADDYADELGIISLLILDIIPTTF